jgi:hypothetical protein
VRPTPELLGEFEAALAALPTPVDSMFVVACRRVAELTADEAVALAQISRGSLDEEDEELDALTGFALRRIDPQSFRYLLSAMIKAQVVASSVINETLYIRGSGTERTAIDLVGEILAGALAGIAARNSISYAHFDRLVAPFSLATGFRL